METKRVRVKAGWMHAGKEGNFYGQHQVELMWWSVVHWDGDDDPSLHKSAGLEVMSEVWKDLE